MKIGKKVISASMSGVIIMLVLGVIATYSIYEINKKIGLIHSHSEEIEDVSDLQRLIGEVLMPVNDYIITADPKYRDAFEKSSLEVTALLFKLKGAKDILPEEKLILDGIEGNFAKVKDVAGRIFSMKIHAGNPEAAKLMEEMDYTHAYPAAGLAEKLHELARSQIDTEIASSKTLYDSLFSIVIFCILGGTVIGIIAGYLISRNISSAVNRLVGSVEAVAIGDLEISIDTSGNDELGTLAKAFNGMVDTFKNVVKQSNSIAKGDYSIQITPRSGKDELAVALSQMTSSLRETTAANERQNWLKTGQTRLNDGIRGDLDLDAICRSVLDFLAGYLDIKVGGIFILEGDTLRLLGTYGYKKRKNLSVEFKIGESLVGQAALEKKRILLTNVPEDYVYVSSGLGESVPRNIVDLPLMAGNQLVGVLELATVGEIEGKAEEFLDLVSESIGIAIASARARVKMRELLEQTQQQAEELQTQQEELKVANEEMQTQQEELKVANEELEEQTKALKASESQLQSQQEELRVTNEELEERTKSLEEQRNSIGKKNEELNRARLEIEKKAEDLELASKYKSEFLANMSHELRTPLNSILILSQLLGENREMNLTTKQQEFARTVHSSGSDLLELINEILDLSKVESGKMDIRIEETGLRELRNEIHKQFEQTAQKRKLDFSVEIEPGLPVTIQTDPQRLKQILKNLLSNAFKFTEKGHVRLMIGRPAADIDLSSSGLKSANAVAFSISDSGIGIPADKKKIVFEAFQQVDGTVGRKYAGTGLGLTISREMTKLIGGEIQMESTLGKGSVFTVYIPEILHKKAPQKNPEEMEVELEEKTQEVRKMLKKTHDARAENQPPPIPALEKRKDEAVPDTASPQTSGKDGKLLLIVEDDQNFAKILAGLAEERGFKCVIKFTGEDALSFVKERKPNAIILDLQLPGIDGWNVLENLKSSSETRHIPIHIMSVSESSHEALKKGSIGFLTKPVSNASIAEALERIETVISKSVRKLLLVEDDANQRKSIIELISSDDVEITAVSSGMEALDALRKKNFDAMILDLGLEDMSGFELLDSIKGDDNIRETPIIIYTGKDLSDEEETELRKYAESIIVKGVRSPERLLDETSLFLHRVEKDLPADKQKMLRMARDKDAVFKDKTILVVDDDMRNVFALSSVLEYAGLNVIVGRNGREGINKLEDNPKTNLVLMDIMMPEMDGYEAMREIRKRGKFSKIPIIALTAKAMKGDRAKCIEAGANDYLSKPIDTDKLISLLRVWLYQ
ncbi:MAG: response regulator [Victivallales bacterium]|jgi:CheY-like chemotaxis protein/HAMP domain-containing protein